MKLDLRSTPFTIEHFFLRSKALYIEPAEPSMGALKVSDLCSSLESLRLVCLAVEGSTRLKKKFLVPSYLSFCLNASSLSWDLSGAFSFLQSFFSSLKRMASILSWPRMQLASICLRFSCCFLASADSPESPLPECLLRMAQVIICRWLMLSGLCPTSFALQLTVLVGRLLIIFCFSSSFFFSSQNFSAILRMPSQFLFRNRISTKTLTLVGLLRRWLFLERILSSVSSCSHSWSSEGRGLKQGLEFWICWLRSMTGWILNAQSGWGRLYLTLRVRCCWAVRSCCRASLSQRHILLHLCFKSRSCWFSSAASLAVILCFLRVLGWAGLVVGGVGRRQVWREMFFLIWEQLRMISSMGAAMRLLKRVSLQILEHSELSLLLRQMMEVELLLNLPLSLDMDLAVLSSSTTGLALLLSRASLLTWSFLRAQLAHLLRFCVISRLVACTLGSSSAKQSSVTVSRSSFSARYLRYCSWTQSSGSRQRRNMMKPWLLMFWTMVLTTLAPKVASSSFCSFMLLRMLSTSPITTSLNAYFLIFEYFMTFCSWPATKQLARFDKRMLSTRFYTTLSSSGWLYTSCSQVPAERYLQQKSMILERLSRQGAVMNLSSWSSSTQFWMVSHSRVLLQMVLICTTLTMLALSRRTYFSRYLWVRGLGLCWWVLSIFQSLMLFWSSSRGRREKQGGEVSFCGLLLASGLIWRSSTRMSSHLSRLWARRVMSSSTSAGQYLYFLRRLRSKSLLMAADWAMQSWNRYSWEKQSLLSWSMSRQTLDSTALYLR